MRHHFGGTTASACRDKPTEAQYRLFRAAILRGGLPRKGTLITIAQLVEFVG